MTNNLDEYLNSGFKALINHELRTPLTCISAAVEMAEMSLTEPELKDNLPQFLKIISNGAQQLRTIVDELLLYGQLEGLYPQKIELKNLSFNIKELLSEITDTLKPAIDKKELQFKINVEKNIPELNADKGKVSEIIIQILINAIKFTPSNGKIEIDVRNDKDDPKNIIISIKDSGPGIKEQHIKQIFEPFFQVEEHLHREVGGLGLGLTITKQLIEKIGGSFKIKSQEGKGTTFNIIIPFNSINIHWEEVIKGLLKKDKKEIPCIQNELWTYTQTLRDQCVGDITVEKVYVDMINTLVYMIETRDRYSFGHSQRVTNYAVLIAKELGMQDEGIAELTMGSLIHDIGKIGISDAVLLKKEPLTKEEFAHIRQHPEIGAKLITGIKILEPTIPMVLSHHEHYNGNGYPHKLKGEDIPFSARIIALADVFDALTSERPYRPSFELEAAVKEIEKCKGTQFDPEIVDVFLYLWRHTKLI